MSCSTDCVIKYTGVCVSHLNSRIIQRPNVDRFIRISELHLFLGSNNNNLCQAGISYTIDKASLSW